MELKHFVTQGEESGSGVMGRLAAQSTGFVEGSIPRAAAEAIRKSRCGDW